MAQFEPGKAEAIAQAVAQVDQDARRRTPADELRALAGSLDGLEERLPAMVKMVLPEVDTEGAAQVLHAAAEELDRLADLDRWATGTEALLEQLQERLDKLDGGANGDCR